MTRYIDRRLLEHAMWRSGEGIPQPQKEPRANPAEPLITGLYTLLDTKNTYALGVETVRNACRTSSTHPVHTHEFITSDESGDGEAIIYRPLTFRENIYARVQDFNTLHNESGAERSLDDRLRLFGRWLDSCTGIAYQKETSKMKIIPVCQELIEIDAGFKDHYLPVEYKTLDGEELDKTKGKYNTLLTEAEVVEHPAWLAAVMGDKALLKEYAKIVFAQLKEKYDRTDGMRFWVCDTTTEDQWRALYVDDLNVISNANGNNNLNNNGSFLHVAPSDAPAGR